MIMMPLQKRLESHVTSQEQTCAKLQTRVEEVGDGGEDMMMMMMMVILE